MGVGPDQLDKIQLGGRFHDLGRAPGSPHQSPELLSASAGFEGDATLAASVLGQLTSLRGVHEIVRHHTEWIDGSGLPDGLRGENIPLGSRIVAVADAFDSLIATRPMVPNRALAELRRISGTRFDANVMHALSALLERDRQEARRLEQHLTRVEAAENPN